MNKLEKMYSVINGIRNILGMKKFGEMICADGTTMFYDGEVLVLDAPVFTDEALTIPFADGEYDCGDAGIVVVTDGLVKEFKQPETPVEKEVEIELVEPDVPETPEVPVPTIEELQKTIEDLTKENEELKAQIADLGGEIKMAKEMENKLKIELQKIGREPSVEPISTSIQMKRELTSEEKFLNSINAIKALKNK